MINRQPLCGWSWFQLHRNDYTQADIEAQTIVVSCNGKDLPRVRQDKKDRGLVKDLVKSYRKEAR